MHLLERVLLKKFLLSPRLSSSEMQRFCSCLVTIHVTLHMKLMGWGGVGWGTVNVRWNLYMTLMLRRYAMILRSNLDRTLMLRDDPSLKLVHDVDSTR